MLLSIRLNGVGTCKLVILFKVSLLSFAIILLMLGGNSLADTFTSWHVLIEEQGYSSYELTINGYSLEGFELCWYATSNLGSNIGGHVELRIFNDREELVGFYRYGVDNVTGWHANYGILPQRASVRKVIFNLYQPDGSPRLVTHLSWLSLWDPNLDVNFYPLSREGSASCSGYESLPRGKVWIHAAGLGTILGWGSPQKSSVDYVVWKSFSAPSPPSWFNTSASVYIDAAYGGTVNVVGEGFTGQGGYAMAIQTGIGQGNWITDAFALGHKQQLFKASSHSDEGFIQDLLQNMASGVSDIILDITEASALGYAKFVLECAQLISTLFDIDEKLAEAKTVVFDNVSFDKGNRVYAWIRIKGIVAALGFAHSVLSFYNDGTVEDDLRGNRGIELGGILIHYQGLYSPEVVNTSPEKGASGVSLDPELKLMFSQNIDLVNPSGIVLRRSDAGGGVVPCTSSVSGNILIVKPNQALFPDSQYELQMSAGTVKKQGSSVTNAVPYILRFTTGKPFMIVDSEPSDRAVGFPLIDTLSLTFNDVVHGKGGAFNSIVLTDSNRNIIGQTAKGADCEIFGVNVRLRIKIFPSLLPGQQYTWEIPKDAFRGGDNNSPNLPTRIMFTTASPVQVIETSPKNNEVDVPIDRLYICIQFSRDVVPGANFDKITLKTGDRSVSIEISLGGDRIYVHPTTLLEFDKVYVLTIPEGALKDLSTEVASLQYVLSFKTAVPPKIVQTCPADKSTDVYRDQVISIMFSEEIRLSGECEPIIFPKTDNGKNISLALNIEYKTLILAPDLPEPMLPANTRITINIPRGSIADLRGTPLQYDYSFSFSTGNSVAPPMVIWTSPSDGETNVQVNPVIYVRFNKTIQEGPNWNNISLSTGSGQVVEVTKGINYGTQLELYPRQQLKKNTQYVVNLPSGCVVAVLLDTPMAEPYSFKFRTQLRSGSQQPTGIRSPADNKGDVNKDGKVDASDAILSLRISVGLLEPSEEELYLADMDEDGEISANDAYIILEKAVGLLAPIKLVPASVGDIPFLELSEVCGYQHDIIQVPIKIDNFDAVRAGNIRISYDSSSLCAIEVSNCEGDKIISYNVTEPGAIYVAFVITGSLPEKQLAQIKFYTIAKSVSVLKLEDVKLYRRDGTLMEVQKRDIHLRLSEQLPKCDALFQNYPNPFNPDTWIPYQLKEDSAVKVKIYASTGQLVRTLDLGYKPAGFYTTKDRSAYWDGKNESGEPVTSGIYFYTIQAGDFTATKKMVIQK